jgi:hypothetical protein
MSGAVTAVPGPGDGRPPGAEGPPIGPHGRMLKRRGSSPACVSEKNLNTERGKSPWVRQHLVRARHARSPVTLRKKDRCAHAQVSAMCLLVAGLYGRRDTPERTLCPAASSCASSLAAGLFTARSQIAGVVVAHIYPCIGILTHDFPAFRESAVEYFHRSGRKSYRRFFACDSVSAGIAVGAQMNHSGAFPGVSSRPRPVWGQACSAHSGSAHHGPGEDSLEPASGG